MKSLKRICTILIALSIFSPSNTALAHTQATERNWSGTLEDGTKISEEELYKILDEHKKWLDTDGREGQCADLRYANLQKARLRGANIQEADLWGADLQEADMGSANLQKADLRSANLALAGLWRAELQKANLRFTNLTQAHLRSANLENSYLVSANLPWADLERANLQKAYLVIANLQEADLWHANLQEANLWNANLAGTVFEIVPNNLPDIISIAKARSLSLLTYKAFPHSLVELREAFKKSGMRKQEREVTYAIKHAGFMGAKSQSDSWARVEAYLGWIFFGLTCQWGMSPARPLFILVGFIAFFMFFYMVSLIIPKKKDGIWKIWIPCRIRDDMPSKNSNWKDKELLYCQSGGSIWAYGFYFSLLSAFHFGWRDLNVGNWITRMQRYEYKLQATGWARTLSGIQSLISVYLLALSVLTYFGRPFESY